MAKDDQLRSGDRLSREEFLRRWEATPGIKKAELLDGIVYLPPCDSAEDHGEPHFTLAGCLGLYCARTLQVIGGSHSTLLLRGDDIAQPDSYVRILPEVGGQARVVDGYLAGPPELIAEVTKTMASYDLHSKKLVYERNGVREYIVWRVWDRAVDWFVLREGRFVNLPVGDDGVYRSEVFPGLWLDAPAVVSGNLPRVLDVLQEGLASDSHQEFADRIQKR